MRVLVGVLGLAAGVSLRALQKHKELAKLVAGNDIDEGVFVEVEYTGNQTEMKDMLCKHPCLNGTAVCANNTANATAAEGDAADKDDAAKEDAANADGNGLFFHLGNMHVKGGVLNDREDGDKEEEKKDEDKKDEEKNCSGADPLEGFFAQTFSNSTGYGEHYWYSNYSGPRFDQFALEMPNEGLFTTRTASRETPRPSSP